MEEMRPIKDCLFKVYVTRPDGYVISKPNLWRSDYKPSILDLEFGKSSSKERTFFEKVYLPKLNQTEKGNGLYATNSSTNIIFHNPSIIVLNNLPTYPHFFYGSMIYSTNIDDVLSDTQYLRSIFLSGVRYEGLLWTIILIITLFIYWM